jgi:DNA polymerase bacteriophage-type
MKIHVDFETYSEADLNTVGAYRYACHQSTGIWCMGYAIDGGDVQIWYPGEPVPEEFFHDHATYFAHNVMFERCIWSVIAVREFGFPKFDLRHWHCTRALAAYYALPCQGTTLEKVAACLGQVNQKDKDGAKLMKRMARPSMQSTLFASDDTELQRLAEYCAQDVRTERELAENLGHYLPPFERAVWMLDQEINLRGVQVDTDLCAAAIRIRDAEIQRYDTEIEKLTGGSALSATQVERIVQWVASQGVPMYGLDERTVANTLADPDTPPNVRRVLEIRRSCSLSSLAKYSKMLELVDDSGRMRDCIEYFGAAPGRWAGRGAQIQNFPRGAGEETIGFCECIIESPEMIEILYGDVLSVLKESLRGAIVARNDYTLAIWDYAQIEARVLAWLAGEQRLLRGFRESADIYKQFACEIYRLPVDMITKSQRFVGKTAVLGLGYSMGAVKFQASLANSGIDLPMNECKRIVEIYRGTFPRVVALWEEIDRLWRKAAYAGTGTSFAGLIEFGYRKETWGDCVWIELPTKRRIHYWRPEVKDKRGSYQSGGFRKEVYGGLLVENIVQAIARDVMANGMLRLREEVSITASVHDEILSEVPEDRADELLELGNNLLAAPPTWAADLPLAVEGFVSKRYRK